MKNDLLRSSGTSMSGGFAKAILWIGSMVIACIFAQGLHTIIDSTPTNIIAGLLILGIYFIIAYRPLKNILATPYFATSILLFTALGTAFGTFVLQNAPSQDYAQYYGKWGAEFIQKLQIHDVFHSWWYVGLFIFLAASLILSSVRKGFNKSTIGFQIAHLSPLLILIGFWVDFFWGYQGLIDLEIGDSKDQVKLNPRDAGQEQSYRTLDFKIRLDTFSSAKYEPEYRIQLWENELKEVPQSNPHSTETSQNISKIIASFGLEENRIFKIFDKDIRFRMTNFYPNFEFQYTYPENIDTIAPVAPGIMLELKTTTVETFIQLRTDKPGQNKIADPSLGTSLEFYWEPTESDLKPLEQPEGLTQEALRAHSPMGGIGKIVFSGKEEKIYFIKNDKVDEYPMETNRFYPFFHNGNQGFTYKFIFPDPAYLKATPGSRNQELVNPVAEVEIWGKTIDPYEQVFLYPGGQMRGGTYAIPGTQYFLALESIKEKQTKFWKSNLSVEEDDRIVVDGREILVNEPLNYKGYRFYQSNYDPQNPKYSGIGVSYNPGLNLIYFGFLLMVGGILWMFYFKYRNGVNSESLIENNN